MHSLLSSVVKVWNTPKLHHRILLIAAIVGGTVTSAHLLLGEQLSSNQWLLFHMSIPALVFFYSVASAGGKCLNIPMIFKGVVTVTTVTLAFSFVNSFSLPLLIVLLSNVAVPAIVSTLGTASAHSQETSVCA